MTFWCSNNLFSKVKQEEENQTKLNLATIFSYVPQLKHQMNAFFPLSGQSSFQKKTGALVTKARVMGKKSLYLNKKYIKV